MPLKSPIKVIRLVTCFTQSRINLSNKAKDMNNRPRTARVLASLLASMTIGAVVLLALDRRPLPAGAFSLASYSRLNSVDDIIQAQAPLMAGRWSNVEVYYSRTAGGNMEQLASLAGLSNSKDVNFHFVIYNGRGAGDGQIETTQRWLRQLSCLPTGSMLTNTGTIRVCIVGESKSAPATDSQLKRTGALVEQLARTFKIAPVNIYYPANWEL